jgi:YVTN family beta-propeller protein
MRTFLTVAAMVLLTCAWTARAEEPLRLSQTIPLDKVEGRIDHMACDSAAQRLYVAALGNNTVEVIDLESGKVIKSIAGPQEPQGICVAGASSNFAVASGQDGKCRLFDKSMTVIATADNMDDADNARYDASANRIYIGYGRGALAVLDADKLTKLADIPLAGHPESFQLEHAGNRIFVNVPSAGHIAVVDRDQKKVIATWPMKDAKWNFPMALDEADHRLFVGCRKPAKLLVLDTETGKTVAALDCVGDTDDVFYDAAAKRIYVSGGAGAITVIEQSDPDHYRESASLATASGARTSLFVPDRAALYLAVPHRGSQLAEIRVYTTKSPAH